MSPELTRFVISYCYDLDALKIAIHKNDNAFARCRIRQGTHIESLSFVLHDVSHAINITSVVSVNDTLCVQFLPSS